MLNALVFFGVLAASGATIAAATHAGTAYPIKVHIIIQGGPSNLTFQVTNHSFGDCDGGPGFVGGPFTISGTDGWCSGNSMGKPGDPILVTAPQLPNYTFNGWQSSDVSACNGANPCPIYIPYNGYYTIYANYTQANNSPPALLDIGLNGSSGVTMSTTANPNGLTHSVGDCGTSFVVPRGQPCNGFIIGSSTSDSAVITAPPTDSNGNTFASWYGCNAGGTSGRNCGMYVTSGQHLYITANYALPVSSNPPPPPPAPPGPSNATLAISLANIPNGVTVSGFYSPEHGVGNCSAGPNSTFSVTAPFTVCNGPQIGPANGPNSHEGLNLVAPDIPGMTWQGWSASVPTGVSPNGVKPVVNCDTHASLDHGSCYIDLPAGTSGSVFANYVKNSTCPPNQKGCPVSPPPPPPSPPGSPQPATLLISLANIPRGVTGHGFKSPEHGVGDCAKSANVEFDVTAPFRVCTGTQIGPSVGPNGGAEGLHLHAPDIDGFTFSGWSANAPSGSGGTISCNTTNRDGCYVDLPAGTSGSVFANYVKNSTCPPNQKVCSTPPPPPPQPTPSPTPPPPPPNGGITVNISTDIQGATVSGFSSVNHTFGNCSSGKGQPGTGATYPFNTIIPATCSATSLGAPDGIFLVAPASASGYSFQYWSASASGNLNGNGGAVGSYTCSGTSPSTGCGFNIPNGASVTLSVVAHYTSTVTPPSGTTTLKINLGNVASGTKVNGFYSPDHGVGDCAAGASTQFYVQAPSRTCTANQIGPGTPNGLRLYAPTTDVAGYNFLSWTVNSASANAVVNCSQTDAAVCFINMPAGTHAEITANYTPGGTGTGSGSFSGLPPIDPNRAILDIQVSGVPTDKNLRTPFGYYAHWVGNCHDDQFYVSPPQKVCQSGINQKIGVNLTETADLVAENFDGYSFTGFSGADGGNARGCVGIVYNVCHVYLTPGQMGIVVVNYVPNSSAHAPALTPPPPTSGCNTTPTLSIGSTGPCVIKVQTIIGVKADGQFGPGTQAAVVRWQLGHGVPDSGTVDAITWFTLGCGCSIIGDTGTSGTYQPPPSNGPTSDGYYDWPTITSGAVIIQCFRPPSNPAHPGVDIANDRGTPIFAAANGTVVYEGNGAGYGPNYVIIDHGGNIYTGYGHMDAASVRNGDHVSKGQIIGLLGNLGNSTGPHLHFNLYSGTGGLSGEFNGNLDPLTNGFPVPPGVSNSVHNCPTSPYDPGSGPAPSPHFASVAQSSTPNLTSLDSSGPMAGMTMPSAQPTSHTSSTAFITSSTNSGCSSAASVHTWSSPLPQHSCAQTFTGTLPVIVGGITLYNGCGSSRVLLPVQSDTPSTCANVIKDPAYSAYAGYADFTNASANKSISSRLLRLIGIGQW